MNRKQHVFSAMSLLLIGCSWCSHGQRVESTEREDLSDLPVRVGAPHPHACVADEDCASGPGVNPENECCDTGVHIGVYGRPYLEWRAGWVRENCSNVDCPTQPPPSPPLPCATQGQCVDGRCVNTCEGTSY